MCTTPLDGKIRKKITKYYENIKIRGSKVIKTVVCLFFACLSPFFYRVPHCKRIEIRSLCHMHQACKNFFFLICKGRGYDPTTKRTKRAPGVL